MSERGRGQRGLKRKKNSCVTYLRSIVTLEVRFWFIYLSFDNPFVVFYVLFSDLNVYFLILVFSGRYCGDSAAITQQPQPHSSAGRDAAGAYAPGGQCKRTEETEVCTLGRMTGI